jgi:hypothetical protein
LGELWAAKSLYSFAFLVLLSLLLKLLSFRFWIFVFTFMLCSLLFPVVAVVLSGVARLSFSFASFDSQLQCNRTRASGCEGGSEARGSTRC